MPASEDFGCFGPPIEFFRKTFTVERMKDVSDKNYLPGLVPLKMPDHVPVKISAASRFPKERSFGRKLLDLVLTDVGDACPHRGSHLLYRACLRDRNELHR